LEEKGNMYSQEGCREQKVLSPKKGSIPTLIGGDEKKKVLNGVAGLKNPLRN